MAAVMMPGLHVHFQTHISNPLIHVGWVLICMHMYFNGVHLTLSAVLLICMHMYFNGVHLTSDVVLLAAVCVIVDWYFNTSFQIHYQQLKHFV